MSDKLKVHPVMLPTDRHSVGGLARLMPHPYNGSIGRVQEHSVLSENPTDTKEWIPQHLYLVSDREIKKGDWIYNSLNNDLTTAINFEWIKIHIRYLKKVEATANPSLGLPLIPESFVKEWVEKQGKIESVYISSKTRRTVYTRDEKGKETCPTDYPEEVIILPTKDSFTREEVRKIVHDAKCRFGSPNLEDYVSKKEIDEWFDKNY